MNNMEMLKNNTELNEDMLDDVNGGLFLEFLVGTYVVGTIAAYGTAYVASRQNVKNTKKKK